MGLALFGERCLASVRNATAKARCDVSDERQRAIEWLRDMRSDDAWWDDDDGVKKCDAAIAALKRALGATEDA